MALDFEVKLNIPGALSLTGAAAERGMALAAEHLLGAANQHVPLEYGDLQSSGVASTDGMTGAVSYDTPYAVRQHEELGYHHDAGRTAKWLENAMHAEAAKVGKIIAAAISGQL